LRQAFEEAIDDYLQMCQENGKAPEKPLKGSFNVRIGPNLHQRVALNALSKGITINKYINEVLEKAVQDR
jgi:predicted HicB family RNase H-like nuclease